MWNLMAKFITNIFRHWICHGFFNKTSSSLSLCLSKLIAPSFRPITLTFYVFVIIFPTPDTAVLFREFFIPNHSTKTIKKNLIQKWENGFVSRTNPSNVLTFHEVQHAKQTKKKHRCSESARLIIIQFLQGFDTTMYFASVTFHKSHDDHAKFIWRVYSRICVLFIL